MYNFIRRHRLVHGKNDKTDEKYERKKYSVTPGFFNTLKYSGLVELD